jgi:hypothetical protein
MGSAVLKEEGKRLYQFLPSVTFSSWEWTLLLLS